jgi:hypothetical protein
MRTLDSNEIDAVSGGDVVEGALVVAGGAAFAVMFAPFCGVGLVFMAGAGAGGALVGYSAGSAWYAFWNAG